MGPQFSLRDRLRYSFDQTIAAGTPTLLLWLALVSILAVAVAALFLVFDAVPDGQRPDHYGESFWTTLNMALDPGALVDATGWPYRVVMLVVAILGILMVSVLIGVLTTGIEGKLNELRRGRSLVLESDHTLILGWSSKITPVLKELIIANENQRRPVVVILADKDKVEMEDQIAAEVGDSRNTRVVCRTGRSRELVDLEMTNPANARSVIVLREPHDNSDATNIKIVLALRKLAGNPLPLPVVVEMIDETNVDAIRRIDDRVYVVRPGELITRIIVQATQQPGLSQVYDEILSFEGSEIYFQYEPEVQGKMFGEAAMLYHKAVVIGLRNPDGEVLLNPPAHQLIEESQELVAIAEDDDQVVLSRPMAHPVSVFRVVDPGSPAGKPELTPAHVNVIGWNSWGHVLLDELNQLLPLGSSIRIAYDPELVMQTPDTEAAHLSLECLAWHADTAQRQVLESLDFDNCDHVVLLSYRDRLAVEDADNRSLLTLIHLRDLFESRELDVNICSEIIDVRNRDLVRETDDGNDFVASEDLVSKVLAQLSENSELKTIFDQLLTADGPEFHFRWAGDYTGDQQIPTFADMSNAAFARSEIAVGYRRNGDIVLNPPKSLTVQLEEQDRLIVLAEE